MTVSENKCVICKSSPSFFKLRNKYHIDKCTYCGLEFANPIPTKKQLDGFYKTYVNIRAQSKVTNRNGEQNLKYLEENYGLDEKHSILDFECGNNEFIQVCRVCWFTQHP